MIQKPEVYMGSMIPSWGENKKIKNITFSITDECNLRCTYCYFTHKTHLNIMTFDIAKQAVDDILTEHLYDIYEGVIWEFIGGEPTLEMELIDKISDYILYKMFVLNHKWLYCYRFMMGSNGLLYNSPLVQKYIQKHRGNLYIAITIDGSKEKHDLSRLKKDGSGSYDDIVKIIPLWQKQFGGESTKATFSHDDLPYLKDSVINLWNLGIKCVSANIVFEDTWKHGDVDVYKQQLYELADYIIQNDLWDTCSVRFFNPIVGTPYTSEEMRRNFCGTGNMMAINTQGDYYPCVRFMPSATNKHNFKKLGSISQKIDPDRLRAFFALDTRNQSSEKCLKCDIAGGCTWCSGLNFDVSSIGTIYERQMFICEMHKANVEVNKYLWRKYELIKHCISPYRFRKLTSISPYNKYLYILRNNKFPSFCEYSTNDTLSECVMDTETIIKSIEFCEKNNFVPIFCGDGDLPDNYYAHQIITISDYYLKRNDKVCFTQLLMDATDSSAIIEFENIAGFIISFNATQLEQLFEKIVVLSRLNPDANINIVLKKVDMEPSQYIKEYDSFLHRLFLMITDFWSQKNYVSINVISNELFANTNRSCGAGKNSYTLAPNGKIYLCAGFYNENPENAIGDLDSGINNIYEKYCDMDKAPLCETCSVRHCKRCVLKNKNGTGEYHIPTELQCVISRMEYDYSRKLVALLERRNIVVPFEYNNQLQISRDYDPLFTIRGSDYPNHGYADIVKVLRKESLEEK